MYVLKKITKRIILLFITLVFVYLIFANLDIKELCNVIKGFNCIYIIPLICSILFSLSLRGLIFKQLLHKTVNPPLIELAHLCITTAAMNIVFPARAGDIYRAYYIGQKYKTDKVKVFGTVMFERIFDIIAVFSFLFIAVFIYHRNIIALHLCSFAGICMIFGIILAIFAYKYNKTDVICRFIITKTKKVPFSGFIEKVILYINRMCNSFFMGFEAIDSLKYMFFAILTSFSIWFFECLNFYIVMQGFNCHIHWSVTLFLIGFIALACMIPSTSIFIGPYQMAVIAAFNMYNINKETALAISLVEQSVVVIATTITAVLFFIKNNITYREIKNDMSR